MTEIELKTAIKVIKAAKKLGVKSMRLGTLEFELEEVTPRIRPTSKVSSKKMIKQAEDAAKQMQFDEAMRELETMHVEDPVAYERALIENDLVGDDTSGDELAEVQHSRA